VRKARDIDAAVVTALHKLSAREEQLVKLRFGLPGRPHRLDEITRRLEMSPGRARAMEVRVLRKLRASATPARDNRRHKSRRRSSSPSASLSKREQSSEREPRAGEMEERELVRIAAFKLEESANRIAALAEEAASPDVRLQLSSLSQQLRQHALSLIKLGPEPRAAARAS
jgi:hypothetical protein